MREGEKERERANEGERRKAVETTVDKENRKQVRSRSERSFVFITKERLELNGSHSHS